MPKKAACGPSLKAAGDAGAKHLAGLNAAESEVRRRRKLLQRKHKRLAEFVADVAFILFVWTCPDTVLCQAYLDSQGIPEGDDGLGIHHMQERYMSVDVAQINAIVEKDASVGKRKLQKAEQFQRDFSLAHWIEAENRAKGNAPTVSLVITHLAQDQAGPRTPSVTLGKPDPSQVSTKWVQRFRKRWRLGRGRFAARDHLPLETVRDKAGVEPTVATAIPPAVASVDEFHVSRLIVHVNVTVNIGGCKGGRPTIFTLEKLSKTRAVRRKKPYQCAALCRGPSQKRGPLFGPPSFTKSVSGP